MTLPYDIARCKGNGSPACEDCQRKTAPWGQWQPVMAPQATEDGCPRQIEHDRYELTDAGREALGGGK